MWSGASLEFLQTCALCPADVHAMNQKKLRRLHTEEKLSPQSRPTFGPHNLVSTFAVLPHFAWIRLMTLEPAPSGDPM